MYDPEEHAVGSRPVCIRHILCTQIERYLGIDADTESNSNGIDQILYRINQ